VVDPPLMIKLVHFLRYKLQEKYYAASYFEHGHIYKPGCLSYFFERENHFSLNEER
jgi:hypothetical protein